MNCRSSHPCSNLPQKGRSACFLFGYADAGKHERQQSHRYCPVACVRQSLDPVNAGAVILGHRTRRPACFVFGGSPSRPQAPQISRLMLMHAAAARDNHNLPTHKPGACHPRRASRIHRPYTFTFRPRLQCGTRIADRASETVLARFQHCSRKRPADSTEPAADSA